MKNSCFLSHAFKMGGKEQNFPPGVYFYMQNNDCGKYLIRKLWLRYKSHHLRMWDNKPKS